MSYTKSQFKIYLNIFITFMDNQYIKKRDILSFSCCHLIVLNLTFNLKLFIDDLIYSYDYALYLTTEKLSRLLNLIIVFIK